MTLVAKLIDFILESIVFCFFWGKKPIYFLEQSGVIFENMKTATSSTPLWTNIHGWSHQRLEARGSRTNERWPDTVRVLSSLNILFTSSRFHTEFQDVNIHRLGFQWSLVHCFGLWAEFELRPLLCYFCRCLFTSTDLSQAAGPCCVREKTKVTQQKGDDIRHTFKTSVKVHQPALPTGTLLSTNMAPQRPSCTVTQTVIVWESAQARGASTTGPWGVWLVGLTHFTGLGTDASARRPGRAGEISALMKISLCYLPFPGNWSRL